MRDASDRRNEAQARNFNGNKRSVVGLAELSGLNTNPAQWQRLFKHFCTGDGDLCNLKGQTSELVHPLQVHEPGVGNLSVDWLR